MNNNNHTNLKFPDAPFRKFLAQPVINSSPVCKFYFRSENKSLHSIPNS